MALASSKPEAALSTRRMIDRIVCGWDLRPDPDASDEHLRSGWWAEMFIKCHSVPQLMKEGLYWTGENICQEEGRIMCEPSPNDLKQYEQYKPLSGESIDCGPYTRHYYLRDLQESPPRWTADLQCHSDRLATLSRFRPETYLTGKNVDFALAFSTNGALVYSWRDWCVENSFNALYDDMPMRGWWPWPKAREPEEAATTAGPLPTTPGGTDRGTSFTKIGKRISRNISLNF
ncbi:hypothetical protein PG994_005361 [Apiospora phragmitis]|uniref:Uncharacterized protein n=1 Tax=Apiospora phragmitis TaxID=2905665 RepID=A0ABR1VC21_9PEZI